MMNSGYSIIYADPPWSYDDKSLNRGGAERHYPTMSIEEICALPVANQCAENSILFLWGTWPKLFEASAVIDAWGFKYKTLAFLWVKANRSTEIGQSMFFAEEPPVFWGMGHWTRSNTEPCLLAVRGKPKRISGGVHQVVYASVAEHSRKPDEVRTRIVDLCGDLPRLELFARRRTAGWDAFGNEIEESIALA